MLKRASLLFLVAVLVISWCMPALAQEEAVVNNVTEETLLNLVKPYIKDPQKEISRGAFAQMLAKAANIPDEEIPEDIELPKDLNKDAEYAKAAVALLEKDILRGLPDGKVYLENPVKNMEAKVLIARVWEIPEKSNTQNTLDSQLLSWIESYFKDKNDKDLLKTQEAAKILADIFKSDEKAVSIVENSNEKSKDVKSLKVKGDMTLSLSIIPEIPELPTGISAKFSSKFSSDKKIHQTISTTVPIINESFTIDQYMDKDYIYMNVPEDEDITKWVKMKNPVSEIFDENFIAANQDILKNLDIKTPYTLLGTEEIEGKKMHKIVFYTRMADMSQFAKMFSGVMGAESQEMLEQAYDVIESMFAKGIIYIGAEDGLVHNAEVAYDITLGDLGLDSKEVPFKLDAIKTNVKFNYYDYNADIKIDIPEEAKDAEELETPAEDILEK